MLHDAIEVATGECTIVEAKSQDGAYVVNLEEKIGFKFIVPHKCGGIAVSYPTQDINTLFKSYLDDPGVQTIKVYITGGNNSQDSITYATTLASAFNALAKDWTGSFEIENHANTNIHHDALTIIGDECI